MLPPAPNINALISKYCVTAAAPMPQRGETPPPLNTAALMQSHRAQVLIDGVDYFTAVDNEITTILGAPGGGARFFFLTAWWLGLFSANGPHKISGWLPGTFSFDINGTQQIVMPVSNQPLAARLRALRQAGVEVRVLAWVSPLLTRLDKTAQAQEGIATLNIQTILNVLQLRNMLGVNDCAMLNVLAHTMGGVHMKTFIAGDANGMRAYISGLDPEAGRLTPPGPGGGWHDIGVKVEGRAAGGLYDFFRAQWNEQLNRPVETFTIDGNDIASHNPNWPALTARAANVPAAPANQYVQLVRTVPQMNFGQATARRRGRLLMPEASPATQTLVGGFVNQFVSAWTRPAWSFAPNGLFEFKLALRQAISEAEQYIFMADQAMYGLEIMTWIRDRMLRRPNLKVILVYGADPADPPSNFFAEAMNRLAQGLPTNPLTNQPLNLAVYNWGNVVVHCKTAIIDDIWCSIGSANIMRRSLYTDVECSATIIETPTPAANLPTAANQDVPAPAPPIQAPSFIQNYRRLLWGKYCGVPPATNLLGHRIKRVNLLAMPRALSIWDAGWGGGAIVPGGVGLMANFVRDTFPFAMPAPFEPIYYDQADPDSRQGF